ncbi:MAG: YecA family protein [Gammaproteobacteria bacterium]|nr:MAG: YecA family protein [Gammaproteobacteria bacterium]
MLPEQTRLLNEADILRLDQFLRSDACGKQAMGISFAHGFLSAIACGPEQLEPSEWLRLMFDEPVFDNGDQSNEMLGIAIRLFAEIERGLRRETEYRTLLENVQGNNGITYRDAQRWCLGFVEGLALFTELWTIDAKKTLQAPLELFFQLAEISGVPDSSYQRLCQSLPDAAEATFLYWRLERIKRN